MRVYVLLLMASSVGSTVVYVRLDSTNHSLAALPPNLIHQCAKGCEKTVGCSGFSIISLECSLLSSPLPSSPSDISFVRTIPSSPTCPAGSKHFATFGQNPPTVLQSSSLATSSSSSIGAESSTSPLLPVTDVTNETESQTSVSSTLVGVMTTVHSNEGETSMSERTSKVSGTSSVSTESSTSTISIPTSTNLSTGTTSPSSTTTRTLSDSKIHPSSSTIFSSVPVKSTKSTETIPTTLPSTISSSITTSSLPSVSSTKDAAMYSVTTKGAGSSTALSSSTSSTSAPSSTSTSSVATTTTESSTSTTTTSIPTSASVSMSTSTPSSTSATTIEPTTSRSSTSIATSPMVSSTTTTQPSTTSTATTSTTSTVSATAPSTSFPGTTAPSIAISTLTTTAPTSTTTTTESTSTSTTTTSISSPSSTTTSPSTTVPTTTSATTPSTSTPTSATSTSPSTMIPTSSTSTFMATSTTTPSVTSTSTSTITTTTTSPTTTEYNVLEKFTFVDVPDSNVSCYYEIRSGGRFSTNGLCPMKGSDPCKEEGLVSVFGNCAGTSALTVVDSTRCVSTLMYSSSTLCVPWEAMFADKVNPTASGNATSQNCPSGTGLAVSSVCTSNPLGVTMMTGRYTDNLLGFTAGGAGLMISSCWSTADNLQVSYCPVRPGYTNPYCSQSDGYIGWIRTSAGSCERNNFFLNMGAAPCAFHSMLVAGSGGSRCIGWDSGSTTTPFSQSLTQGSSWYVWNGTLTKAFYDGTIMGRLLMYEEYMILPRVLVIPTA